MDSTTFIAVVAIILFVALLSMGVPLFVSLFIASVVGFVSIGGWELAMSNIVGVVANFISSYLLTVIPVFILMGSFAHHSNLMEEVFGVAEIWFGRLRGGLALSTVAANAIFAACSGSSVSSTLVIGKDALPAMRKNNYPLSLASGVVAASGTLASLIPPSILICIYALMVEQSVGKLLVAGIIPGIVSALIYSGYIIVRCMNVPVKTQRYSIKEKLLAMRHLWVIVALVLAILYTLYTGWATPTEVGAIGVAVVCFLALVIGRMSWKVFMESVKTAIYISGQILILVGAAIFFGRFLAYAGLSVNACEAVIGLQAPPLVVFIAIMGLYLLLGCFMGAMAMLAVSLPIVYPIVSSLGFDPIWFGIVVVVFSETALISPPIGMNVFATNSIAPDIPITTIFKGSFGFMCMDILTVFVFYLFPSLITFLPNRM
jgi:tripartite ATP-independent transporter DctM subunit